MNRDDIIRMAREAGSIDSEDVIETVYAAFTAAEREECAKVCIEQSERWHTDQRDVYVAHECAAAIRARGAP